MILEFGGIIIAILIVAGILLAYRLEKKMWNNGICKKTGKSWKRFDTDSQGGRGYVSENEYTWISYPVDKEKR